MFTINRPHIPLAIASMLIALLFVGCPPKPTSVDILTAMDNVDDKIADIPAGDPDTRAQAIAQYLATRPEFVETGIADSTGTAWGRTEAGEILCVVDELPAAVEGAEPAPEETAKAEDALDAVDAVAAGDAAFPAEDGDAKALPANRTEMPGGTNCLIVSSDHVKNWIHTNALAMWFYLPGTYGYKSQFGRSVAEVFRNGSIERLATLTDTGILYMHTVVSAAKLPTGDEIAAILTSVDVTPANEATYRGLLRDGSLVIMLVPNIHAPQAGGPERFRRFGITSKFIRERMKLAPNALVYLDAAYGNHADLRQAFLDIGASLHLGWSDMLSSDAKSNRAAIFFAQHMMNEDFLGGPDTWPDSPTRPFDYQNVYTFIMSRGYGRDTTGPVPSANDPYLALTEGPGNLAILCPSIAYLKVDENPENPSPETAILHIYGSFGSDPGTGNREVYISQTDSPAIGEPLQIETWTPAEITCLIPARPSAGMTSGRIIVLNRGIRSNAVPLTEWFLPVMMYTRDNETSFYNQATFTLHIRLDVHGYRSMLNQPYPLPAPPASLYAGGSSAGRYSTGAWVCGGAYADLEIHKYPEGMEPVDLGGLQDHYWFQQNGSGSFGFRPDFIGGPSALYATAAPFYDKITLENPKPPAKIRIQLAYNAVGRTISWGFVDLATGEWGEPADVVHRPLQSPISNELGWGFTLELNDDYAIIPGSHDIISWQQAIPSDHSAPQPEDKR